MIIEFTAVPGSGKTYLSEELSAYLKRNFNDNNYSILTSKDINEIKRGNYRYNFLRRVYMFKSFMTLVDINIMKLILIYAKKDEPFRMKIRYISYMINILANYEVIIQIENKLGKKCIFVLDEGLLHVANMFFDKEKKEQSLSEYFDLLIKSKYNKFFPNNSIYIFIDSSMKENIKRINQRKQGWPSAWRNFTDIKKQEVINSSFNSYNSLKQYIYNRDIHCITINNATFKRNYEEEFDDIKQGIISLINK